MINQRKRVAKRLASGLLAGALALGGLAISGSSPAGALPLELERDHRVSGADRYATAAAVADEIEDEHGIETLVVASGENFPDALAAAALTGIDGNDGAIVLVKANEIPDATLGLLNSVDDSVDQTYVVGGESAISDEVLSQIEDIMDNDVDRISGENRYDTALEVADEVGYDDDTVIIVSGESWADAVTVGAYASDQATPIILATTSGLTDEVADELEDRIIAGVDRAIIVGGTAVISGGLEDDLVDLGLEPAGISRVAGPDRYITNLLWQLEVFNDSLLNTNKQLDAGDLDTALNGREAMLVTGANFPDALAAAPFAAAEDAHVILVNPSGVGAAGLTLAGASKTPLDLDVTGFGIFASSSALVDFGADAAALQAVFGNSRILEEIWAIGGQAAVPDSVVSTMAAAASDSMDCILVTGTANDESEQSDDLDGPDWALTIFPKNLQQSYPAGWAGGGITATEYLYGGVGAGGGNNNTELEELRDNANDYWDVEGADVDTALPLDLNGDGFQDSMLTLFTETLAEGASIDFEGLEQESDIDKYTTDGEYYGLRELNNCSTTVASDSNGPEADMYAVIGDNSSFIQFSEPMLQDYDEELEAEFGWDCTTADTTDYTSYFCEGGTNWAAGDTWDLADDTYYDAAGNELDDSDLSLKSSGTYRPTVTDFSITCSSIGNAGMEERAWEQSYYAASGTNFDTATAVVELSDNVTITALSGLPGVQANDWSFTLENERGLVRPVVSVDGTAVTITIDRQYHDGEDIARAINSSSVGRGFGGKWSAVGDGGDDLAEADDLGFDFTTGDNGGTEATQTCSWEATFSEPVSLYEATAPGATYNDATLSSGDFQIVMDGDIVNDDGNIGFGFEGGDTEGGFNLSGTIQRTTAANTNAEMKWKWVTTSTAKAG